MTTWRNISSDIDRLQARISVCRNLPSEIDPQAQSMISEHLCVAISGRLEQNLKAIFVNFADRKSELALGTSVSRLCQQYQNPKPEKIVELVGLFDKKFAHELSERWDNIESDGNQIKQMVSLRIQIAHQTTNNSSITIAKIEGFFKAYKNTVTELYKHFLP